MPASISDQSIGHSELTQATDLFSVSRDKESGRGRGHDRMGEQLVLACEDFELGLVEGCVRDTVQREERAVSMSTLPQLAFQRLRSAKE